MMCVMVSAPSAGREVGGLFEMRVFVVPRYPSRGSVPVCKMEDHTEVELYECVNKSFGGL